jgi:hypothetical protein
MGDQLDTRGTRSMIHRLRFDDRDSTTRFHQTLEVEPVKALVLLLGPLMKTALKKRMAQLGDELKEYTERQT